MRKLVILLGILIILLVGLYSLGMLFPKVGELFGTKDSFLSESTDKIKIVSEESVVTQVVKEVGPSVVTIAADINQQSLDEEDPFSFFFRRPESEETEPQNIGSGFLVSNDGLIVTNKHVVSDPDLTYTVITTKNQIYKVQQIYRDPLNDIALIKITPSEHADTILQIASLGDSSKLEVGQLAIAIGTALGQFNNTVTTGVISGLGRGVVAGSIFEGTAEELDDVIQTDAAINPGNSGGPLLNSSGQVIGVNTAVSVSGQNIGFALPINTIKDSIKNFNETGQFNRAYLGVGYRMISEELASENEVPQGALIDRVVQGSAAENAGIQVGDIITKIDGQNLRVGETEVSTIIAKKKIGDSLTITVYRENNDGSSETLELKALLQTSPNQ